MEKLTKSPRLNKLLYQMEIYNFYDVVNHLPRKYEDLHPSDESKLVDKQKITLVGKLMRCMLYAADLFRFRGLFADGDRLGQHIRHPDTGKLRSSLHCLQYDGFLAQVAYFAVNVVPRLCITPG